jgi:hypothetical protein
MRPSLVRQSCIRCAFHRHNKTRENPTTSFFFISCSVLDHAPAVNITVALQSRKMSSCISDYKIATHTLTLSLQLEAETAISINLAVIPLAVLSALIASNASCPETISHN